MKRRTKYNLQIFKKLKRGNYLVSEFNAHKKVNISSNSYLGKYKFIEDIVFQNNTSPDGCADFYENGYDCNLISNGEAVVVNWIYGQSEKQNKGIYSILLSKEKDGTCRCLYLGLSTTPVNTKSIYFLFDVYKAKYINKNQYPLGKLQIDGVFSRENDTTQSYHPGIMYSHIDHNFYKTVYADGYYNESFYINKNINRKLYDIANILKIKRDLYGYSIKKESVVIDDYSISNITSHSISLYDDGNYNLIDKNIDTGSFIPNSNLVLYLSFDEKFNYEIENKKTYEPIIDYSIYNESITTISGSLYTKGFKTSGQIEDNVGTALVTDGYPIVIDNSSQYEFDVDDDYAISFFISASVQDQNTETSHSFIFAKQDYKSNFVKNKISSTIDYKYVKSLTGVYPFSVRYINSGDDAGRVYFSRYGGVTETYITSSTILTGSYHHIICQKSGSVFQIYVNGILDSSGSALVGGSVFNTSPIFIGSLFDTSSAFYGILDEVRLYNKSLSDVEISALSNTDYNNLQALQTNKVGNVFYESGIIIITSPNPKYKNVFYGKDGNMLYEDESGYYGFDVQFKSSKTIYQHEIIIPIKSYEFNFSSNPTLKKGNKSNSIEFKPFVSSSNFNVYFTTIGLYNNNYELVAIAKLNTPIPKYQDKDLNIIVRFDVE